jgi:hypothetical protein
MEGSLAWICFSLTVSMWTSLYFWVKKSDRMEKRFAPTFMLGMKKKETIRIFLKDSDGICFGVCAWGLAFN